MASEELATWHMAASTLLSHDIGMCAQTSG
jgi:hypothetical protein